MTMFCVFEMMPRIGVCTRKKIMVITLRPNYHKKCKKGTKIEVKVGLSSISNVASLFGNFIYTPDTKKVKAF
eukprot:UN21257